jgi:hypothetical protein
MDVGDGIRLNPYFANNALYNVLRVNTSLSTTNTIKSYMDWYINHLNIPDKWGIQGSIYDYRINTSGIEICDNDADSTDSYGATFVALANRYLQVFYNDF